MHRWNGRRKANYCNIWAVAEHSKSDEKCGLSLMSTTLLVWLEALASMPIKERDEWFLIVLNRCTIFSDINEKWKHKLQTYIKVYWRHYCYIITTSTIDVKVTFVIYLVIYLCDLPCKQVDVIYRYFLHQNDLKMTTNNVSLFTRFLSYQLRYFINLVTLQLSSTAAPVIRDLQ